MTTAARPTFDTAKGGSGRNEGDLSKLSKQYSSRDLPSHTKLKYRQPGQDGVEETKQHDHRKELEDRERSHRDKRSGRDAGSSSRKPKVEAISLSNLDADDPVDRESEDSDSEDDTAALMEELNRIKAERAVEKAQKDAEKAKEDERIRTENILCGNPLLNAQKGTLSGSTAANFAVKRRWDDDVVFKNCAKGQDEKGKEPSFINDSIRSEFHQKFMQKYIK